MTDKDVIEFFSDKRGKINANKTRESYLNKHSEYKTYLENRYNEFMGYTATLSFILAGLNGIPKCKTCGKSMSKIKTYCSNKCQLTDPVFIKESHDKVDYVTRTKKFKQTCLERHGVEVPAQNPDIMRKMVENHDYSKGAETYKQTCQIKYNVNSTFQIPEIREKAMQTKLKNRPNDPNNSAKTKQTMLERYNATGTLGSPELRQKVEETKANLYGNPHYNNPAKIKATKIEKYEEDPTLFGSKGFKQNMLNKFGVEYYCQSIDFNKNRKRKFYIDDIGFDSLPEVAFYLYHKDLGHTILHETCQFEYIFKGNKHVYTPDFEIDGQLYEIKGPHFFKNNKMINPFDRSQDDLYEAKHQCMISNSVNIITDFSKYLDYFKSKNILFSVECDN